MPQFNPLDLLAHARVRDRSHILVSGDDPKNGRGEIAQAALSLLAFVKLAWPILEPANPLVESWHLDALCDHLQAVTTGGIRNLLINIPPRHMKSLAVCVFWPAWEWITHPHRRFLFASYAMSLSERDSVKCRRLMESQWYQQFWGDRFQLCGDQNTKLRYDNDKAGHRIATSVGGSATGEGGDYVIVDDPHNVIDRESQTLREEALTWWDETMSTRLNDPRSGAKIIVMQRIHEKDLSGHVLEQGGYEHLFLPAEFEPARRCVTTLWRPTPAGRDRRVGVPAHHCVSPAETVGEHAHPTTTTARHSDQDDAKMTGAENPASLDVGRALPADAATGGQCPPYVNAIAHRWTDPRTQDGDLLWPQRIGAKEIADFKIRLGPEGYAGQFQQRPSPAGGAVFRKEWFRYYGQSAERKVLSAELKQQTVSSRLSTQHSELSTTPESPQLSTQHSELSTCHVLLKPDGSQKLIRPQDCERFAVMDPAGTEPGEGRRPCYTVIQVWDVTKTGDMLLVHQYRRQVRAADAADAAIAICREFDVAYIAIEKDGMGLGVVQQVKNSGIAVRAIKARGCKEARSQTAEIRMANGQIYFPHRAAFLFELEKELLSFPRSDYADQVDALSHAAMQVQKMSRPYETENLEAWERDAEMALEADEAMYAS